MTARRSAFTLVEMLVVIGIIAILIGILVPVFSSIRNNAKGVTCANNMRQLSQALVGYASAHKGWFPVNSADTGQFWYKESVILSQISAPDRVGRSGAVPHTDRNDDATLAGGVFLCPNDLDDAVRSYSMNVFASGGTSAFVKSKLDLKTPPGRLFRLGTGSDSCRLLLLLESWPELPVQGKSPPKYVAQAVIGLVGKPGQRFGGGAGIYWADPPDATKGRFPLRTSQITFYRHNNTRTKLEDTRGRANFSFGDGHVEMLRHDQLVSSSGGSSFAAMWSPADREIDK